jgi:hypothetical protein
MSLSTSLPTLMNLIKKRIQKQFPQYSRSIPAVLKRGVSLSLWFGLYVLLLINLFTQNKKTLPSVLGTSTSQITTKNIVEQGKIEEWSKLIQQMPDYTFAYFALTDIYLKAGDDSSAVRTLDLVLQKDPTNTKALDAKLRISSIQR